MLGQVVDNVTNALGNTNDCTPKSLQMVYVVPCFDILS